MPQISESSNSVGLSLSDMVDTLENLVKSVHITPVSKNVHMIILLITMYVIKETIHGKILCAKKNITNSGQLLNIVRIIAYILSTDNKYLKS